MQWKVRRTLASSIHELAVILGEEVAAQDLVPIFNGFIKVTSFFLSLGLQQQKTYSPMKYFLKNTPKIKI